MKNFKRFLTLALALVMVLSLAPVAVFASEGESVPELPTATATEIQADGYTFAMNFKAVEPTAEQLAYYGDWAADFELTVNKDVTFDGTNNYLGGQYDKYSENWIKVPTSVEAKANQPIKIMQYISSLMGQNPTLTYKDVVTSVKDFDCGVFFTEEYLADNADLEVTLQLVITNGNEREVIGDSYTFKPLPSAIATEIQADGYTFAMNFKAVEPTAELLAYYGDWAADFVLTVNKDVTFNANGEADGYLGGQYDAWSANWINVPFENVTVKAGESLKIMEYATANVDNYTGTTYKDVVNTVKDFDCGVYFTPEFLEENQDLVVTLQLVISKGEKSHVIGNSYTFEAKTPALPTATVSEISDTVDGKELTFGMNFVADPATEAQLGYYGNWAADFVLTVNKDVTFDGTTNFLAGQYDKHSADWIKVPTEIEVKAGEEVKIMQYLGTLMGSMEAVTYKYIHDGVKNFDCGVYFTPEFLAANEGLVVTLELRMYNPDVAGKYYVIGDTYTFTVSSTVDEDGNPLGSVADALDKLEENGGTAKLVQSATTGTVTVTDKVTLDLNGKDLEATYVTGYGNIIDSTNGGALLKVKNKLSFVDGNSQLPIYDVENQGYRFFTVAKINYALLSENKYAFQPLFSEAAKDLLLDGDRTGITMTVHVTWDNDGVAGSADFVYTNEHVVEFLNSYVSEGQYSQMFTLTIANAAQLSNLKFSATVVSDTGVKMAAPAVAVAD